MKDVLVKDIMSHPLIFVDSNATIQSVAKIMIMKNIGGVLVSDGESYRGIITKKDIVRIVAEGKATNKLQAKEIMTTPLKTVNVSDTVLEAAKKLVFAGVRRIVVSKDGKPVGMVSDRDIVKVAPDIVELLIENIRMKG